MWQNNGFGTGPGSPYQTAFNQNDMLFGGGGGTPMAGQQGFAQFQPNLMDTDAYQPEVGLYNQDVFTQSQHMSPQHQVCFVELVHLYPVRPILE